MGNRTQQWPWFAVMVRTGMENTATVLLENAGYKCFLPLSECKGPGVNCEEHVQISLISNYLFCRMNPRNRLPVLITPGVMQIVGTGETALPLDGEEVAALRRIGKSGLPAMPWPYLKVGHIARIEEGPLQGLSGIIIKIRSGLKLVSSVTLLQRSIAVEIDPNWVGEESALRPKASRSASRQLNSVPTGIIGPSDGSINLPPRGA